MNPTRKRARALTPGGCHRAVHRLCHGGELFDRIAECGGLAEDDAKRYFVQILHALSHCHENRVYHRDLKPENILLDADDNAKVADFGLAAVYRHVAGDASYLQHTKVGSVMYAAPEVLVSTALQGYDAACADIWSLGVILFSMLSGTLPFTCAAASKCKRYAAVLRHGIGVMCPEHLSPQVTVLLSRLLHPDPKQRITPEEALCSEWVRGTSDSWPREYIGNNKRAADEPAGRSWTITMRAPAENLRALPSSSSSAAAPQPTAQQQQQQQQPSSQTAASSEGASSMAAAAAAEAARAMGSADPACATGGQHQLLVDGATGDSSAVGASRMLDAARSSAASGAAGGDDQRSADAKFREYASSPGKRKRDEVDNMEARVEAQEVMGAAGRAEASGGGCAFSAACPPHVTQAQPRVASCSDSSKSSDERSQPSRSCSQEAAQPGAPLAGPAAGLSAAAAAAAATLAGDSSGPAILGGLPLRGCVSEYVQRFGWSSLPNGTQQLLRDILQTLCATRRSAPSMPPCPHAPMPCTVLRGRLCAR